MPKFNIESYLNSLPENILEINIDGKGICYLPNIDRFTNLQCLSCDNNYLIYLPRLPKSICILSCLHNKLTSLPKLPSNLQQLYCSYNPLNSLPTLPENLQYLYCENNKITSLPSLPSNLLHLHITSNKLNYLSSLPSNLQKLHCNHNQLTSMPNLPESLKELAFYFNPIWQMRLINTNDLIITKQQIKTLNSFRHLYYSLRYKHKFRNWLWEKVREPNAKKIYNPMYLIENLGDEDDLDTVLDNWK
jgi:hypothetical protein